MIHSAQTKRSRGFLEASFSVVMRIFGVILFCFFIGIASVISYSLVFDICKLHYLATESYLVGAALLVFSLFVSFNVFFNYIMATFTGPGGVHEQKLEISMQHYLSPDDVATVLKSAQNTEVEDLEGNQPVQKVTCRKCDRFKPERAHHCSICNTCVLKMDHHCPWISNCVGHKNHRYFLLMILYMGVGTTFYCLASIPIVNAESYWPLRREGTTFFPFCLILSIALAIVFSLFILWNWFLAITGQTAIEFWTRKAQERDYRDGYQVDPKRVDFRLTPYKRNLEYIFGTSSLLKMLLPSVRSLDHNGMHWGR